MLQETTGCAPLSTRSASSPTPILTMPASFNKAEGLLGHRLASAPVTSVSGLAAEKALRLAVRYRRQVPARLRYDLGLTDQADLSTDTFG